MIKLYFYYIFRLYSRSFMMILMGITLSIAFIDYLKNASKLTGLSNQKILYIFYSWEFRLEQFYPLAIVFAATVTYMSLVKSNALVSMFSFGYTKRELFIPFVSPAIIFYLLMLSLQLGELSYAKERAWSILHGSSSTHIVNNLFFKYGNSFVYVKHLDPIRKTIKDVTVFELDKREVKSAVVVDIARFDGEYWIAQNAILSTKTYTLNNQLDGFDRRATGEYRLLKDYKPKVIELIYEGESLSLLDAINTYSVLKEQGLDTDKIRATFYSKVILPLFVFAVMIIIFFRTPYHVRYMNQELVWALALGGTLVIWGLLYALYRLSASGAISPELAIVMPVMGSAIYGVYLYFYDTFEDSSRSS